ncbi:serine protease [Microcoleus sp. Pol14C6]|uniref:serine protease n=1 Tax=unclassified Microcoleus TaxID=2642155 RepID=UPI002FD18CCF
MIKPTTISEKLLFSTVRIAVQLSSGEEATGTGFFFNFLVDEQTHIPAIITNKHVVAGAVTGSFQLHELDKTIEEPQPSGDFFTVGLDDFENRWISHPDNNLDLCAMLFQPLRSEAEIQGKSIFNYAIDNSSILSKADLEELSAVEEVLMIGYPTGLWDEVNNLPLIRRGTTATHPAVDFQGRSTTVIDAACFPGSSGSPVLIVNEGMFTTKSGTFAGYTRVFLLGVLFSGPCMTAQGEIVIQTIPTSQQPISLTNLMIHLGYIVQAKEIKVLGEHIKQILQASGNL